MYSVRIDKGEKPGDYIFRVSPCAGALEMVALDSAPGVIAFVDANNPAHACQRAWYLAEHMHDDNPEQLPADLLLASLLLGAK